MFELFVALKYLVPRRSHLSVSLIAFLSVAVISLIVWLVLVFLSVTEGIERNWLDKLTTLNAPLRITPTHHYYNSYYYQIDGVSIASEYTPKNIAQKLRSSQTDPYREGEDGELPAHFPKPDLEAHEDPVQGVVKLLRGMQGVRFQDFELSGALMRLQLLRQEDNTQGYLTQVSYLATLPDASSNFSSLLLPPTEKDLNHLLYLTSHSTELSRQDAPALSLKTSEALAHQRLQTLLSSVAIQQLKPRYPFWQLSPAFLPEKVRFAVEPHYREGKLHRVDLHTDTITEESSSWLWKEGSTLYFQRGANAPVETLRAVPILTKGELIFDVKQQKATLFEVETSLQRQPVSGFVQLDDLVVVKADFSSPLSAPINEEKEVGVLLAKGFIDNGVLLGDRGYLSYSSTTSSSLQEHRLPIFVSGFYDPGVLSVGNKCILVPPMVTETINASSSSFNLDKTQSNGFLVWFKDVHQARAMKEQITQALTLQGLDRYWKVSCFYEYDFAKDLLEQFQSDKYLFMLVGILILVVGCCNIISMLVLLVSDKKQEIGIFQAMGASKLSIACIFGICGIVMGMISCLIGTLAALLTLENLDSLVHILSLFQGHDTFNATFFGNSLPKELSPHALRFILIATPLLSLIAGLIPAIKACRLNPSELLRS
jgi:lipoprotein-releasing system permease protein